MGLMSQFVIVLLVVALMGAMAIEPARQLLDQRERVAGMQDDSRDVEQSNDDLRYRIKQAERPPTSSNSSARGADRPRSSGRDPFVVMPSGEGQQSPTKKKQVAKHAEAKKHQEGRRTGPRDRRSRLLRGRSGLRRPLV